jgi:hypothetical protein
MDADNANVDTPKAAKVQCFFDMTIADIPSTYSMQRPQNPTLLQHLRKVHTVVINPKVSECCKKPFALPFPLITP